MSLSVDPLTHGGVSAVLANLVGRTVPGLPPGAVPSVAGDPISQAAAARLTTQSTALVNSYIDGLNQIHLTAHHIGAGIADLTNTDTANAAAIGVSGVPSIANPVAYPQPIPHISTDATTVPATTGSYDPMTFATWLQNGSEQGPADYTAAVGSFLSGSYTDTVNTVSGAQQTLESWQPHGERLAAAFGNFQSWHGQLGQSFGQLTNQAQSYQAAYRVAAGQHPTPQQIAAAQQELLTANASGDSTATAAAYQNLQHLYSLSQQVIQQYQTSTEAGVPANGVQTTTPPTLTHPGWWFGQGYPGGATGAGLTGLSGWPLTGTGTSAKSISGTNLFGTGTSGTGTSSSSTSSSPTSSTATSGAGTSTSATNSAEELQMLASMMPAMGQLAQQGASLVNQHPTAAIPASAPLTSQIPLPGLGGGDGGAGGAGGLSGLGQLGDPAAVTEAPIQAAAAESTMPRTPIIGGENQVAPPSTPTSVGGAGMPYAPYMPPMSPTKAGGKDRDRVVAWNPDRPMYVDDTPHTQMVIGEAPSVAPSVTPSTPADSAPAQNGGAV